MDTELLFKLGKPAFYLTAMDASQFADFYDQLTIDRPNAVVRTIRGNKCRTVDNFFNEFAASLQFPYYFGENWDAFEECINDMTWLKGDAYILMVDDAQQFLSEADSEDIDVFLRLISSANLQWASSTEGFSDSHPTTPFHILLRCPEAIDPSLSSAEFDTLQLAVT